MSDNEGNEEENLQDPYANRAPSTPSSIEMNFAEDRQLEFVDEEVTSPLFGNDWSLEEVIKKFEQDELFPIPASERESSIRNQVQEFFTLFYQPPEGTSEWDEKYLAGKRFMAECIQSLNLEDFFSSSKTRNVRDHYDTILAQYEDIMDPRSVNSLTYKSEMKIKYIPFQLIRILLNDIIDFVDFLEGSELPPTSPIGKVSLEVQLARVRDEFEKGVQQIEFDTLHNLENDFNAFVLQNPPEENQNLLTFEILPSLENELLGQSPPRIKRRFYELDPELDLINSVETHMRQLRSLQDLLEELIYSSISRSAAILEYCKKTPIIKFQSTIQRMIHALREQLDELSDLRKIITRLLAVYRESNKSYDLMLILKVKVKTALMFRGILTRLSDLLRNFSFQKE